MAIISVTERSYFKQCRRQHDYMYRRHLQPVSEAMNALWIGRLFHYAMAGHYLGRPWEDAMQEWLDVKASPEIQASFAPEGETKFNEILALVRSMMTIYIEYARDDTWEVLAVEQKLQKRVKGTIAALVGHLDLVVRIDGRLWVVDHKGLANFADPVALEFDDQMTAYLWLVRECYDEMPAGAIYNQVRKKIPSEPLVLKNGGLSRAKGCDTTPAVFRAAIDREGLDPDNYTEILERLAHNEFVRRETIARSSHELDIFGVQLRGELREIYRKGTAIYPNQTRDCVWQCSFKDLCRAETFGGDVESIIEVNYVVSEGRSM